MVTSSYRIALAQFNPTVGDYAANTRRIIEWIDQAEDGGARLIVFPEMALCGYPVWDLANKKRFVEEGMRSFSQIVRSTRSKKVHVLLGFIDPAKPVSRRNQNHNAIAWIHNGKRQGIQHKTLLPTYDVFLEEIFFEPARKHRLFSTGELKIGPTICEDIWDEGYDVKPIRLQAGMGADLIINISASPFYRGIARIREDLVRRHVRSVRKPVLYVNQVGGQDDLVFDGRSFLMDETGRVIFRAPAFDEGLFFYDWQRGGKKSRGIRRDSICDTPEEMYRALVLGVRDYCSKNHFERALIGLSGGIDSALVAAVAVDALGPKCVTGVTMPSQYSSKGSWKDSEALAANLGMEIRKHPIGDKFNFLLERYWNHYRREKRPLPRKGVITLSMENLQARVRGLELMFLSNHESRILLSTGNKSELAMGYCTLYGDMAGGLCVLGDIYKTDVYRLARWRNTQGNVIPDAILTKAPSAELRPDQKDQDSLPPYEVLDEILRLYIEENRSRTEIFRILKAGKKKRGKRRITASEDTIIQTLRKVDHNEYKRRQTPPLLRVTQKAWFGRRMPITNRFEA